MRASSVFFGRPPGLPDWPAQKAVREEFQLIHACQQKAPEALAQIERLMMTARAEKVRLGAAAFIIERAYGKAVARLETSENPFEAFPSWYLLELRERLKRRLAERALGNGDVQKLGITDQRTL
jgi:hypothetical protein